MRVLGDLLPVAQRRAGRHARYSPLHLGGEGHGESPADRKSRALRRGSTLAPHATIGELGWSPTSTPHPTASPIFSPARQRRSEGNICFICPSLECQVDDYSSCLCWSASASHLACLYAIILTTHDDSQKCDENRTTGDSSLTQFPPEYSSHSTAVLPESRLCVHTTRIHPRAA